MTRPDGRCHSWRPGARPHEPRHEPGRCHRCWRPCWEKVPGDGVTVRCEGCIEAILQLNTARLTRLLLEEAYVPERLSERLVTDLDAGVALTASERLGLENLALEPPYAPTVELEPLPQPRAGSPAPGSPAPAPGAPPEDERAPAHAPGGAPADDAWDGAEPDPAVGVPTGSVGGGPDDEWGDDKW